MILSTWALSSSGCCSSSAAERSRLSDRRNSLSVATSASIMSAWYSMSRRMSGSSMRRCTSGSSSSSGPPGPPGAGASKHSSRTDSMSAQWPSTSVSCTSSSSRRWSRPAVAPSATEAAVAGNPTRHRASTPVETGSRLDPSASATAARMARAQVAVTGRPFHESPSGGDGSRYRPASASAGSRKCSQIRCQSAAASASIRARKTSSVLTGLPGARMTAARSRTSRTFDVKEERSWLLRFISVPIVFAAPLFIKDAWPFK